MVGEVRINYYIRVFIIYEQVSVLNPYAHCGVYTDTCTTYFAK